MKNLKLTHISNILLLSIFFIIIAIIFKHTCTIYNSNKIRNINFNEVPYISTYYINPIVYSSQPVTINFYITDYHHTQYVKEDFSNKFSVTIKIDGKDTIILKNLKAGDHSVNLGTFTDLGEKKFSILCTDSFGRNSHELFNYLLVKKDDSTPIYTMTYTDLINYNINNANKSEYGIKNSVGLQQLLNKKSSEGYSELKLLPGIYTVDSNYTLYIPTKFTLNMNESTLKLNGFSGDTATIVSLNNTFDSHVINGTIEGDYYEHDYNNSPNNSEWVIGINIGGESKYSSFENLTVKNITGYGGNNGLANSPNGSLGYTYLNPIKIKNTFQLGDIDRTTGENIKTNNRTVSEFIDITGYEEIGYLTICKYLGYQGNSSDTWNMVCHFYDSEKKIITSTDGYQYRRVAVPPNTKYMKITILSKSFPEDLSIQYFRIPTHCTFKDIIFENCRCIGLAQAAMKDMLVENCEFINCGETSAKCAYDAEDGWDLMQDVTLKNLNFHDNPNNELLTCAGHNFNIENIIAGKIYIWERTNSYSIKDCKNITSLDLRNNVRKCTGYNRIFNNTIKCNVSIVGNEDDNWNLIVKDCKINSQAENTLNSGLFLRCDIGNSETSSPLLVGNFTDCKIFNKDGENFGGIYTNCKLNNINGNMHKKFEVYNSKITNSTLNTGPSDTSYIIKDSILTNLQINLYYWHQGATTQIENCKINNDEYLLRLPHYSLNYPLTLIRNKITCNSNDGLIIFYDDRPCKNSIEYTSKEFLTLYENSFTLKNSIYVITGLNKDTINIINIKLNNNKYKSPHLLPYNPEIHNNRNINIIEN